MPQTTNPINVRIELDGHRVYESLTATAPTDQGQQLLVEATAKATGSRTIEVTIITPGAGSSAVYPAEVLEQAAKDRIFAEGTHMHIDHPTESERYEKPERTVQTLAAVLTEDARWDGTRLVANARLFDAYADDLLDKQDEIGVSINAFAEAEAGKPGEPVTVTKFTGVESIDFVTHAGRGGYFRLVESNRRAVQAATKQVGEARASEIEAGLRTAIKSLYAADKGQYAWLVDWDESTVIFEWESPDNSGLYQQTYENPDGGLSLTGSPIEVRKVITYQPTSNEETEESDATEADEPKGNAMPEITQEDVDKAVAEAVAEERAKTAVLEARESADPIIATALSESQVPAASHADVNHKVRQQVIVDESGKLDEDALTKVIKTEIEAKEAEVKGILGDAAPGTGIVTENGGGSSESKTEAMTEAEFDKRNNARFGITVTD
ncbi:MAG: hypothetical protein WAS05_00190 [Candidatus Nanopelagicales bacterium]